MFRIRCTCNKTFPVSFLQLITISTKYYTSTNSRYIMDVCIPVIEFSFNPFSAHANIEFNSPVYNFIGESGEKWDIISSTPIFFLYFFFYRTDNNIFFWACKKVHMVGYIWAKSWGWHRSQFSAVDEKKKIGGGGEKLTHQWVKWDSSEGEVGRCGQSGTYIETSQSEGSHKG